MGRAHAAFRNVFHNFDPMKVARMTGRDIEEACRNPAIIRNQLKIRAAIKNALTFLKVQESHGSFDSFIWSFTDGKVIHHSWKKLSELPATSPLSDTVSKALKNEGFSFVGSTICYAFLQATGVVNDHLTHCFRYEELKSDRYGAVGK